MKKRTSKVKKGRGGAAKKTAEHDLGRLRTAISAVDTALVRLLNERAQLAVEVGRVKRAAGLPVYARTANRRCWMGFCAAARARCRSVRWKRSTGN